MAEAKAWGKELHAGRLRNSLRFAEHCAMMLGVAGSDTPKNSDETEALLGGRGYHWPVSPVTEGGFALEATDV